MAQIIILGSAAAIRDARHDYTHFLLSGQHEAPILIDAGSNPLFRIQGLGIDDSRIQDIILTHFHPDHVAGLPNTLMQMWMLGRQTPLRLHGLRHCLQRVEAMLAAYGWDEWPDFFPVSFHAVDDSPDMLLIDNRDFRIQAIPVRHFVPTIGLRIVSKASGRVAVYSCDTEPCPALRQMADGADILLHEAAGPPPGHSTARQAGELAAQAGAGSLYLIHYHVWQTDPGPLIDEAYEAYPGPVHLCQDLDTIAF